MERNGFPRTAVWTHVIGREWKCSNCGETIVVNKIDDTPYDIGFRFCPKCNTRMKNGFPVWCDNSPVCIGKECPFKNSDGGCRLL